MRLSLRTRLALGNTGLLALALLAFAGATRYVIGQVLQERLDRMLVEQAESVSRGMRQGRGPERNGPPQFRPNDRPPEFRDPNRPERGGPGPNGPPGFPPARQDELGLLRRPRIWHFGDEQQPKPWAPQGFEIARTGNPHWDQVEDEGSTLRVYSLPIFDQGEQIGAVQTAISTGPLEAALASVTYSLLLLLPAIGIFAGLGGVLLTRRALAPVRQLTDSAAQIAPSNLDQRLPEPGGDDEFDALSKMLNGMLARLEDAFARQKQFTSHASHELRTPLAAIKMATNLLQRSDLPPALRKEALDGIEDSADRANRLVSDLLFLTRAENATLPVRLTNVDLKETLETAVQQARAGHQDPVAAPVLYELGASQTKTDRDLLVRLVSNLVSNALRHTPPEGKITLSTRQSANTLVLTLTDTGHGIGAEHLSRLGQPFYRPDIARARDDGGAGLGISICHAIAGSLGGTLTIESTSGQGTTVTLQLPSQP